MFYLQTQVVEINESQTSLCVRDVQRPNKSIECAFDRVFGPESVQEDVFLGLVPVLDTVIKGFNACVLAYGQTGAGKTHTLIGTRAGFLQTFGNVGEVAHLQTEHTLD